MKKKLRRSKKAALLAILAIGVVISVVCFFGKSIVLSEKGSPQAPSSVATQVLLGTQSSRVAVSPSVMSSNDLPRATSKELTALRRVFMATLMELTASSRARGDFMFAGRSVNPSTVGKAVSFAQRHDTETMGLISAFMVQLRDHPASSDYKELFGDVPLSSYVPPRGYVLMLTEAQLAHISALDSVEFVFEVTSDYKIDPFLAWLAEHSKRDILVDVLVDVYAEADERAVLQHVRALGVKMERADSFSGVRRLKGAVALSILSDLAAIGGVEWIEMKAEMKLSNNLAVLSPRMNVVTVWNNWGLEGEGHFLGKRYWRW